MNCGQQLLKWQCENTSILAKALHLELVQKRNKKLKVSKDEFAKVLCYWLCTTTTEKEIKEKAKDFGFKIRNDSDLSRIFSELLIFNMWLIVYTCEAVIDDENKCNECLDIFHRVVYIDFYKKNQNFGDWMNFVLKKYQEYYTANETEHPSTPLWVVAKLVIKNVQGETNFDLAAVQKIIVYRGLLFKHLATTLKNYDIE